MESQDKHVYLKIFRYNPQADASPHYQNYRVPLGEEKMSLLQALEYVYREQDDTLAFRRYCCGIQYCNSCLMLINGKRSHACLTMVKPGVEIEVAPLPGKRVRRDLITD